jgi:hypothetical protein
MKSEGSADNCIMTGFFSGAFGSHNALIIIRPGFHCPPLRIGFVDGGYAARALARLALLHSAEHPLDGACANASSVRVPAIVPDQ